MQHLTRAALVACAALLASGASAYAAPTAPVNVLPQGTFETLEGGKAKGWNLPTPGVQIVTEGGNHYMQFTNADNGKSAWAGASLKLDPTWEALRVSARLKVSNFKAGTQGWHSARVILNFRTADGKDAGYPEGPKLTADSNWVTQSVTFDIPKNAVTLQLQPGLWGSTGVMGLDDLIITPVEKPSPFEGDAIKVTKEQGLAEGNFQTLAEGGKTPLGWEWHSWASLVSMGGNRWVKITNPNPLAMPAIRANVRLPQGARKVKVSARLKATRLVCGKQPWQNARVVISPRDKDGLPLASLKGPALNKSAEWSAVETVVDLEPNTQYLVLWAGLWQATGILEIDDVQVQVIE